MVVSSHMIHHQAGSQQSQGQNQPKHIKDVSKLNFNTDEIQTVKTQAAQDAPTGPSHPAMDPAQTSGRPRSVNRDARLDPDIDQIINQVNESYESGSGGGQVSPSEQQAQTDKKVNAIIQQLKDKHQAERAEAKQNTTEEETEQGQYPDINYGPTRQELHQHPHVGPYMPSKPSSTSKGEAKTVNFGSERDQPKEKETGTIITNLPPQK